MNEHRLNTNTVFSYENKFLKDKKEYLLLELNSKEKHIQHF